MATEKQAPVINTVTMLDGRKVDFAGAKRLIKTSIEADGKLQVRLDFVNGESRLFTLRPDMLAKFALHGAEQKLGDEISGTKDIDDAVEEIDSLMQRLDAGEWLAERASGGGGMAGASVLARALVEATGQPITVVRTHLATLTNKVKLALRVSPEVAPIIKKLEDEKAARAAARGTSPKAAVDVGAALAGLRALGTPTETPAA